MSTSANVTHYTVMAAATGQTVARYSQHHMCKPVIMDQLKQHTPYENFRVKVEWPDEDEAVQLIFDGALDVWIRRQEELDLIGAAHARARRREPVECDCLGNWHGADVAKTWPEGSVVLMRRLSLTPGAGGGLILNQYFLHEMLVGTGQDCCFMLVHRGEKKD